MGGIEPASCAIFAIMEPEDELFGDFGDDEEGGGDNYGWRNLDECKSYIDAACEAFGESPSREDTLTLMRR